MKQLLIILAIALSLSTSAQTSQQLSCDYFAEQLAIETQGTITKDAVSTIENNGQDYTYKTIIIDPGAYFSHELLKYAVHNLDVKYDDVVITKTWRMVEDWYEISLKVDTESVMLSYNPERNYIIVVYGYTKGGQDGN